MPKNILNIPPAYSFIDVLAQYLLEHVGGELSRTTVILSNRRGCRSLRDALLRHSAQGALLLPRMLPLGDLDPDELILTEPEIDQADVIAPLTRQAILMRLLRQHYGAQVGTAPGLQARLARTLARFIDQIDWEGLEIKNLPQLVPDEYAKHWQLTHEFLEILSTRWPEILQERQATDPANHRRRLLEQYAEKWTQTPPDYPVIVAGSTGSIPATANLMKVVAGLPKGAVILPGLDTHLSEAAWEHLDVTHPQYGLKHLLETLEADRQSIQSIRDNPRDKRTALLSKAMQPSCMTHWKSDATGGIENVTRVECASQEEEAGVISLIMREALETPGKTAALVTADRDLATRVTADLSRWGLCPDDTAGVSFAETQEGRFLLMLADFLSDQTSVVKLLQLLKHPKVFRLELEKFERQAESLEDILSQYPDLTALTRRFNTQETAPFASLLQLFLEHVGNIEDETIEAFLRELQASAADFPDTRPQDFYDLFAELCKDLTLRQPHGYHPRLFIMGPIEARLQKADTVVLGGLNEGSWPPITSTDPWLNRPMRSEFGLPLPERRIGLSAHDFSQAFAAEKVVLTRAIKVGGTPTVPSRWLMRLDTVLQASGGLKLQSGEHWRAWYHALDHADSIQPAEMPKPSPALADRPKILSVTRLESLASDPYQFYAQKVLKVSPLDGIEQPLDGAHKGTIVHAILQQIKDDKIDLHAADAYLQCLEVARVFAQPSLWWMRVERLLDWFVTHEQNRPKNIVKTVTEVSGSIQLDDITITAIADRIDIYDNGAVDIIDYKTGFVPSQRDMLMGRSLQLPMEAAIQLWGGFEGVPHGPVNALSFWKVTGGEPAGEEMVLKGNPEELAQTALQHCETLIEQYLDPDMVFAASPFPGPYNVYGQLSRLQEWAA